MKTTLGLIGLVLVLLCNVAAAGILENGGWAPAKCGDKPNPPTIADQDVDSFNKSVKALNEWQQQAKTYFECMVNEANADSAAIANSANSRQAEYRQSFERISAAVDAAKKKLDK